MYFTVKGVKMKKALTLITICLVLVIGCGKNGGGAAVPVDNSRESVQRKLSGKVVVYCPSPANLADKMAADFENKTGVNVEMYQGTTGEILARLEAEKTNPVADIIILASWADGLAIQAKGDLLSYTPANVEKMNTNWVSDDNTLYGYSASAAGVIYNTKLIPELNADWEELSINPAYKDTLAIPDPIKSGSCKDFLSGYIYKNGGEGWKILENMAKANKMTVPGANKAALDAVITGEKGILIAGVDYNAYESIVKGEPINIYYPKSGTVINPRPAMILKTSANLANARAFMDYLLSDDGQALVSEAYLLPGRTDIKAKGRTGASEIPIFPIDWDWMIENSTNIAQRLIDVCK
jgi:iron(III) transport system substrate-binding protein